MKTFLPSGIFRTALFLVMMVVLVAGAGNAEAARFLTTTLPQGTTNSNYNTRVVVVNSNGAVTFSVVPNPDGLPAGLALDTSTGLITGIPTSTANNNLIIRATDDSGSIDLAVNLKVSAAGGGGSPSVHFTTTSLPDGTVGTAYTANLTVSGGTGPFIYITDGLPMGLGLDGATGIISGTPGEPGTFFVTATAYDDSDGSKTVKIIPLTVLPEESSFRFTTLVFDNGEVGAPYEDAYLTSGAAGTVSYTASGLPAGLTLNGTSGVVSGTPTEAGTFRVEVTADDGQHTIGVAQYMIVAPSATSDFYWNFTGLPVGIRNVVYTNQPPILVSASNGGSVTYNATGLPSGILYNNLTGELSGTPTAPLGIYPVTFTATDTMPEPDEVLTLTADFVVMGPEGGDTSSLPANYFVQTQVYKTGVPGRDAWTATIIYNADRTTGNAFDPAVDSFRAVLGGTEINLAPGDMVASSPVLYSYKKAATESDPTVQTVKFSADRQIIKLAVTRATISDSVPGEFQSLLRFGDFGGTIKQFLGEKGKFLILTGYRNTGFVVAKAALLRKGAGLDTAGLNLLLASPAFSYQPGDVVQIQVRDAADNVLVNKVATELITGTQSVDSATGATVFQMKMLGKDPATANRLTAFKYDNKKGKLDIKLAALDLGLLTDPQENITVRITIGANTYTTSLTLFDPALAGRYSDKMPK